jgi:hypothetical protein
MCSVPTIHAKQSLRAYASLAHRLGLRGLKHNFKQSPLAYPHHYSAASALFQEHGAAMKALSSVLLTQLTQLLTEDSSLMYELYDLQVVAQVKEPYSFWRKFLKKRQASWERQYDSTMEQRSHLPLRRSSNLLSLMDTNDGVALRVILKARKVKADETGESTQARERMLCYYFQRVLQPPIGPE